MKSLQNYANKRLRKGATLIELIVVMVIIGILGVVVGSNIFAAKDDANKTRELDTIGGLRSSINIVKAQNNGNIYDITTATGGVRDKILSNITTLPADLTYFVSSNYMGQNTSTNLIALAVTDEAKIVIKESVEKLDKVIDGTTSDGINGSFRYSNDCSSSVTNGSDCYYQVQLAKSGTLPFWETPVNSTTGLNTNAPDSSATGLITWTKLIKQY